MCASGSRNRRARCRSAWSSRGPTEIVEERPHEVAAYVHAAADRRVDRRDVLAQVGDAQRVGEGIAVDHRRMNPDGYDVWRQSDDFALGANVGAPPDPAFTKGQDWGFSPLHPQRLRENGYDYMLRFLRFQMRHTGMLRIDHVMGLHRLYWIPKGSPASEGAFVTHPADEWLALLSLESHRNKTVLVGENLGTVPPEVDEAMVQHHLRQTYVFQYELRPTGKNAVRPPSRNYRLPA